MPAKSPINPSHFKDSISKILAALHNSKQSESTPWLSAAEISSKLRDNFGIPIHWKTIEAEILGHPDLVAKRKRSGRREYQIMAAGEALIQSDQSNARPQATHLQEDAPTKEVALGTAALPTLFIGSSTEGLPIANALQENLEHDAEVTVWTQGVFRLTRGTLEELLRAIKEFEFAVFVFSPDDETTIRDKNATTVRDNVIFELGLFMGALGQERVFFVMPRGHQDLHLPTDLIGITPATFNSSRRDQNLKAALGSATNKIREAIKSQSRRN